MERFIILSILFILINVFLLIITRDESGNSVSILKSCKISLGVIFVYWFFSNISDLGISSIMFISIIACAVTAGIFIILNFKKS